ncbi:MAG: hypothetical protein DI635_05560 [Pseudoxanthomonas suwonensis]|nr:MAG: hypothetical protein DI635_05560 [Pseudoxanthomonas suwonensis]
MLLLSVYALDAKRRADGPQWITASAAASSVEEVPQALPRPVVAPPARPVGATTAPAGEPMVPIDDLPPLDSTTPMMPRLTSAEPIDPATTAPAAPTGSALAVVSGRPEAMLPSADAMEATPTARFASPSIDQPVPPQTAVGTALLADGQRGLEEALRGGLIRPAGNDDLRRWIAARTGQADASTGQLQMPAGLHSRTFVVERAFQWPGGMHALGPMVFLVESGVPYPRGDAGQSALLDLSTGACRGALCNTLIQTR